MVYRILNEKGEKVGVPIKASLIYNKPTLKTIEGRFAQNDKERQHHKQRVKNAVDISLLNNQTTLETLQQVLRKQQISMVLRSNESKVIYGITYIDHQTKCVFNGSDLGKPYSANAIQQRCQQPAALIQQDQIVRQPINKDAKIEETTGQNSLHNLLQHLTQSNYQSLAAELKEDRKRKRKKQKPQ